MAFYKAFYDFKIINPLLIMPIGICSDSHDHIINIKHNVLISGHTHKPSIDTISECLHINPGSVHGFESDGMVALFDTTTRNVRFKELNDE